MMISRCLHPFIGVVLVLFTTAGFTSEKPTTSSVKPTVLIIKKNVGRR